MKSQTEATLGTPKQKNLVLNLIHSQVSADLIEKCQAARTSLEQACEPLKSKKPKTAATES